MWLTFGEKFTGSCWTSPMLVLVVVLSTFASAPVSGWEHDEPTGTLLEGNKCRVRSGEPGICTRIEACVAYADGLRKKTIQYNSLVRCSFVGITEIICCPAAPRQPLATRPPLTTTTSTTTARPTTTTTTFRPIVVGDVTLTGEEEYIDLAKILRHTTTTTRKPPVMPNNPWNTVFNGDGRNIPNPPQRPPNAGWNAPFNGGGVPNQQGVNHPVWTSPRPNVVAFPTTTRRSVMPVNPNVEWIDPSLINRPQGPTSGQFVQFPTQPASSTSTPAPIAEFNDPFQAFQFRPGSDDPALVGTSTIRTIVNNELDEWDWSSQATTVRAPATRPTTTTTSTTTTTAATIRTTTAASVDWIMDALKNFTTSNPSVPLTPSATLTPLIDDLDPFLITPTTATPESTTVGTVINRSENERPSQAACRQYNSANPAQLTFHILDGVPVNPGDYPHMGGLIYNSSGGGNDVELRCGSSLISERYVLTAAHCVYDPLAPPTMVRFGVVIWNSVEDGNVPVDVEVESIILHPEYVSPSRYHDIALIRLARPVQFTPFVRPSCLHADMADLDSSIPLVVIGWGVTDVSTRARSDVLLMTNVTTVPLLECNATHISYGVSRHNRNGLNEGQYCAFDKELKKDSCNADSGGPLQWVRGKEMEIVGIVSFGNSCGTAIPSVYARVAYYLSWIESVVWPTNNTS